MSTEIVVMPKLVVTIEGKVKDSNLPEFQAAAKKYVDAINRVYTTDEDFGQAEVDIKSLKEAEKLVKTSAENIVNQTHDIDEVLKTLEFIGEGFRTPRLEIEREVKEQKDSKKVAILTAASGTLRSHIAKCEAEVEPYRLEISEPNFIDTMKNRRTLKACEEAVQQELDATIMIVDRTAADFRAKLAWYKESDAKDYPFVIGNMQSLMNKPMEDFQLTITSRVDLYKKQEAEKLEKDRERIRAEEKAKIEAEAKAKSENEERAIAAQKIADTPRQTEPTEEVKEIPAPAVPRQVTEEENNEKIGRIRAARTLCDSFLAFYMTLEETAAIRQEMVTFLQKTDWVE